MDSPVQQQDNERRWAHAMTLLTTGGDPVAQRRAYRRRLALVVAVTVLVSAIAAAVGVLLARHGHPRHGHPRHRHPDATVPGWRVVLGLTVTLTGLVLEVIGVLRLKRSGGWSAFWRTPLLGLTRQQRRHLLRQVRGRSPVEPDRLPLLRDLARRLDTLYQRTGGAYQFIVGGGALLLAGNAIGSSSRWALLAVLAFPLYPVALLTARRDARRAAAFLAQHPDTSSGTS